MRLFEKWFEIALFSFEKEEKNILAKEDAKNVTKTHNITKTVTKESLDANPVNNTDNNEIQKQSLSKSKSKLRKKIKDIRLADKPGNTLENNFLII